MVKKMLGAVAFLFILLGYTSSAHSLVVVPSDSNPMPEVYTNQNCVARVFTGRDTDGDGVTDTPDRLKGTAAFVGPKHAISSNHVAATSRGNFLVRIVNGQPEAHRIDRDWRHPGGTAVDGRLIRISGDLRTDSPAPYWCKMSDGYLEREEVYVIAGGGVVSGGMQYGDDLLDGDGIYVSVARPQITDPITWGMNKAMGPGFVDAGNGFYLPIYTATLARPGDTFWVENQAVGGNFDSGSPIFKITENDVLEIVAIMNSASVPISTDRPDGMEPMNFLYDESDDIPPPVNWAQNLKQNIGAYNNPITLKEWILAQDTTHGDLVNIDPPEPAVDEGTPMSQRCLDIIDQGGIAQADNQLVADWNGDGFKNDTDFFDFVNVFFDTEAESDFNCDGGLNDQDWFDFTNAFFN